MLLISFLFPIFATLRAPHRVKIYREEFHLFSNKEYIYINPLTEIFGNLLRPQTKTTVSSYIPRIPLDSIQWNSKRRRKSSLFILARDIKAALIQNEWFVTGNCDPKFFSPSFSFQDPDVQLTGIKRYAEGVRKIFSDDARAEIISVDLSPSSQSLIATWRLSGSVNILGGLKLKPFLVYSELFIDFDGLICFQKDRFSLPGYDIVVSAVAPGFTRLFPTIFQAPVPPIDKSK